MLSISMQHNHRKKKYHSLKIDLPNPDAPRVTSP